MRMFAKNQRGASLWVGVWLVGVAVEGWGAGFALIEQGVSGMGTAYATGAAAATDATTLFFNPAGMTRLPGVQYQAAAHIVATSAEFNIDNATTFTPVNTPEISLGTNDGGDAGSMGVIPNLYYSRQLSDRWYVGLGINVPFGLATEYDRDWVGRYYAVNSELMTININPSLAYKVNEHLSIGAGVSVNYADAELTNAIDFGTALPGLTPTGSDGFLEMTADDWSFGTNIGLLYELSERTRVGLAYRSSIKHTLTGDADFTVPDDATTVLGSVGSGAFVDTGLETTVRLPDIASLSLYHDISPRWAVMADVTWTNWSTVNQLRIEFDNPAQADGIITLEWRDVLRYAIGVAFTPNSRWTYRAGIAYDESPTPSAELRSPRIPDEDRIWLAFGLGYRHTQSLSFDLGYAHLFINDPKLNKTAEAGTETFLRGTLQGDYDASVDLVSAQISWTFL